MVIAALNVGMMMEKSGTNSFLSIRNCHIKLLYGFFPSNAEFYIHPKKLFKDTSAVYNYILYIKIILGNYTFNGCLQISLVVVYGDDGDMHF